MVEHLSPLTIELLTGRRLAPRDLLPATRHLSACAECQQRVSEVSEVANRVEPLTADLQSATAEPLHLHYEQLEAYVDESLDLGSREEVKRHLALCAECQSEAVELQALRDNLSTYPLLSTAAVLPVTRQQSFWARQQSFWEGMAGSLNLRPSQLALVTAALVVLVAVLAVLLISRRPAVPIVNKNSAPQNQNDANQNSQLAGTNTNGPNDNRRTPEKSPERGEEAVAAAAFAGVIDQAIAAQQMSTPASLREVTGQKSKLLGPDETGARFSLLSPLGTLTRSTKPQFHWQRLPGATSYSVAILDLNLNLIEKSSPSAKTSWVSSQPLQRNVVYLWQVTALKDGREVTAPSAPDREARFKIISSRKATSLAQVAQDLAGSHLKLGIVYAHEGLLDDAERELRAAIVAGEDTALARKLLQSTRQMRR